MAKANTLVASFGIVEVPDFIVLSSDVDVVQGKADKLEVYASAPQHWALRQLDGQDKFVEVGGPLVEVLQRSVGRLEIFDGRSLKGFHRRKSVTENDVLYLNGERFVVPVKREKLVISVPVGWASIFNSLFVRMEFYGTVNVGRRSACGGAYLPMTDFTRIVNE
jgi:hypothetical protein